MATGQGLTHDPVRARASEVVILTGSFLTNSTDPPDGITGDISTVVRADTGDYTLTWKTGYPQLDYADAAVSGDEPTLRASAYGGTPTAGTLTVSVYADDGTSGVPAAADTNDKRIRVVAYYRNTARTSR